MDFTEFTEYASEIEPESRDKVITRKLSDLLEETDEDLAIVARFIQGRIFPAWSDRKIDVGPSLLYESLKIASGTSPAEIKELVKQEGDPGAAAASLDLSGQMTLGSSKLTLGYVYGKLKSIADSEGEGSQEKKVRTLADLFMKCGGEDAKYLARLVLGEMRVGVGEGTVRDALVQTYRVDKSEVERGLMVTNDVGKVASVARDQGTDGLEKLEIELGRPVKPMLAQAAEIGGVTEEWPGEASIEYKFDGARLQIHAMEDGIQLYSRNLEELTNSLPDVVEILKDDLGERDVILDAEVVAIEDGDPLPFQEVLKRLRRKYRIDEMSSEIEMVVRVFDIIYRDGELISHPLRERYRHLDEVLDETDTDHWLTDDVERVREIEREALSLGQEGLMAKNPDSNYSPGKRGRDWLKIKPEPETLDVVVLGGEWGEGRRADFIGSYLLGVKGKEGYEPIGRVATGLTDEDLMELTERFEPLIETESEGILEFQPRVVFEVGYDEIQESPQYGSGYALRFPRFLEIREDLEVDDTDTVEKVERLANRG
ncbi:MAG: ATP-dependent DNA ligase [Halobacteria archaeon]